MTMKRVLYVSKNVVPPWHDGSKNLVRDLANHVTTVQPIVMASAPSSDVRKHVQTRMVYREKASRFAPAATENFRVLWDLASRSDEDLRHYVFAPNPRSSSGARWVKRVRRAPVVQTVASCPLEWRRSLFFGDRVVAQSHHANARLAEIGVASDVIWPCAAEPAMPSVEEVQLFRRQKGLGMEPLAVYAGDYEVSSGAQTVAKAAEYLVQSGMRVVFACRKKTERAALAQAEIEALHGKDKATHLGELEDMRLLLAASSVLIFPVDNLWGKVDLPLVLLEALALGKPIVVAAGGPLEEIPTAVVVPPREPDALLPAVLEAAKVSVEACKEAYAKHFHPDVCAKAYERIYQQLL
jgi:glycosyltransferase involved in cell wall biosynthesis